MDSLRSTGIITLIEESDKFEMNLLIIDRMIIKADDKRKRYY
jgi:hypothetical protein